MRRGLRVTTPSADLGALAVLAPLIGVLLGLAWVLR